MGGLFLKKLFSYANLLIDALFRYGCGDAWVPSCAVICTCDAQNHWDFERFRLLDPALNLRVVAN